MSEKVAKFDGKDHLNRQAGLYSLAAAAAGVSALALAMPAQAEVVVTKAHLPVGGGVGVTLDMNHDGVADFAFSIFTYQDFSPSFWAVFNMSAVGGGAVVASRENANYYASALMRGARIGPSARFDTNQFAVVERSFGDYVTGHTTFRSMIGKWGGNPQNRYLGVRFLIGGETHYGWIRLNVTSTGRAFSLRGLITGYAYETVANKPILVGTAAKPAVDLQIPKDTETRGPSLGMLASGADAVPMWRRERGSETK